MTTPRGADLLHDPRRNKSTAFSEREREALGLLGLLPEGIDDLDTQLRRALAQLDGKTTDLERYIYLSQLQDTDETLFYRVVMSDPARFMPIVYTPTVGEACQKFGHLFRRPRGLYLSIKRRGRLRELLRNWTERDVRCIVVTSGERILGLGDLGANGMGIPIGKLALYTAAGGVPPQYTLPVLIDVGTNNETLLADPLYLGIKQTRVPDDELDAFVDEFVAAVEAEFPGALIQFEDWAGPDAIRLLDRYRERVCCFNDDIQGTAAVALAGILGALRITGTRLAEQRFLFLGAGSAAIGTADLLVKAMCEQGLGPEEARSHVALFDRKGLVTPDREALHAYQRPFAQRHAPVGDFVDAIRSLRPTGIIGLSTVGGAFDRRVIEAMSHTNARPMIFAYSNPTSRSECTAEQAYAWSGGRAVFAGGSPFPPVRFGDRTFVPGQGNNVYVFPAIGMAVYATRARRVTDEMFIAAASAVAEQVTPGDIAVGLVYPPVSAILETELRAAARVAEVIFERGLANVERPADVLAHVRAQAYVPRYRSLV
ncbi:MAG TPA: NAD-dependent malic enzyme [Candidatus Limnocylindria bacterium]|jgi:malate dehydrogenase (oxaloacetate-decarboxylating)(NADP+)|nr:NAD-dependent malic enzyme [Candidatus Limnocylindria bacterium]